MRIFYTKLSSLDWSTVKNENLDENMDCFITRMNELYCECFPLKSKLIDERKLFNPARQIFKHKINSSVQ